MSEEDKGRNRTRLLSRAIVVIIVLAVNIMCVLAVVSLVESATATPNIYVRDIIPTNEGDNSSSYISVAGTVVNPISLPAYNVSVFVDVYDKYVGRGGLAKVGSNKIDIGTLPGNSVKSFDIDVSYPGGYFNQFNGGGYVLDYGLLLKSRFDFGIGFFVIVLPMTVLLPFLDVYSAYKLGLFGWMKNRKRVVATTIAWAISIALVVILQFWLFYITNPGILLSNILGWHPGLLAWQWVLIFLFSVVAGSIIADLGTAAYSLVAILVLSLIFEFLYGSFFAWFGMGYGASFSMIIPGVAFSTYLQSVLQDVLLTFLRMMNIAVPCFCVLGVFVGVIIRSYFDPSVDA